MKLLALAPGRRLHREQVIDALWPDLPPTPPRPRLHKAAHYARRALGAPDAVRAAQRRGRRCCPAPTVRVDVDRVPPAAPSTRSRPARRETRRRGPGAVRRAAAARRPLRAVDRAVARRVASCTWTCSGCAGRWEELLARGARRRARPTWPWPGRASTAATSARRSGSSSGWTRRCAASSAPRRARRPRAAAGELGSRPVAGRPAPTPDGRDANGCSAAATSGDLVRDRLDRADGGARQHVLVHRAGRASASRRCSTSPTALARRRGWRTGRGTASAVEGPGRTPRCSRRSATCAASTPRCWTGWTTTTAARSSGRCPGGTSAWSGETSHQRLFVAAAELVRLAAGGPRAAARRRRRARGRRGLAAAAALPVPLRGDRAGAARARAPARLRRPALADRRKPGARGARRPASQLAPLDRARRCRLLADRFPDLDPTTPPRRSGRPSGGLPFRGARAGAQPGRRRRRPAVRPVRRRRCAPSSGSRCSGSAFTTDELLAVSGCGEDETYRQLEAALAALVVEPAEAGYRFRHALVREALVDADAAARCGRPRRARSPRRWPRCGAPPGRVAHQFLAAGLPSRAVPYARPGGRDGRARSAPTGTRSPWSTRSATHAGPARPAAPAGPARRPADGARRPGGGRGVPGGASPVTTGTEHRLVRARLARAAAFAGDFDTARGALAGLELEGDAADAPILLARGNLAYFTGDMDGRLASRRRGPGAAAGPDDPWHLVDLVGAAGPDRAPARRVVRAVPAWSCAARQGKQRLATALFDAHLCVAEYLLYGPVPYDEVIEEAEELRRRADPGRARCAGSPSPPP